MQKINTVCLAIAVLTLAGILPHAAGAEPSLPVLGADQVVLVDEAIWEPFNWASFDQDKIVSFKGYQYTVYWDANRVLTVARRCLQTNAVQHARLADHVLAGGRPERDRYDGHRNTVLGISPGDGRLHLSWDHHNDDLNYTRSRKGFLTEPPERISAADFEPRQPIATDAPQRVTYPRFFNDLDETLYFFYRSGGSGRGNSALFQYDAGHARWDIVSTCLFGQEGTYAPWDNSDSRNAYMHDLLFDAAGRLHTTWVYREASRTWASNHDLHYAYSDDRGRTWRNNAGALVADTRGGQRIVLDTPGIVVYEIPVFSWVMNQCAMVLDSKQQPHVATYHMAEPFRPADLQHNPPLDQQYRLNYYHYWRDPQGEWHRSEPLPMPLPRRRPMIVAAPDDTMIVYFPTEQGFHAHVARAADQWSTWQTLQLTGPEFAATDATKPDRRLMRDRNILSFTVDPNGQKPGRGMAILDFQVNRLIEALDP